jgi:serine protease AprX
MKATWLLIAFTFAELSFAKGPSAKMSSELQALYSKKGNVDVIVQFDQAPTEFHHQKIRDRGGRLRHKLYMLRAGSYMMPASEVADLANDPTVTHISVDHKLKADLDYTTTAANASAAWQSGWDGTGIGVAVIDSGISAGADFKNSQGASRIVYTQDFTGGNGQDLYGHGTHVAGIIAGNGANSKCQSCTRTLQGLAPNANLLNFRVLDRNGEGSDSDVIAAIEQAIQLKSKYNIRVINLSLGRAVTES